MELKTSESIKELGAALQKFHAAVPKIVKTIPGVHNSKYANLGDVQEAIGKPMADANLVITQFPIGENGLVTRLIHTASGEYMEATSSMTPTQATPQQQGAVITYQRRYALGAILGLNIERDDDGEASSMYPDQAQQSNNDPFGL